MGKANWLIYGATGYTGRLIVERAIERGWRPIVAGRSARSVAELAAQYNLEGRTFDLLDRTATRQALADVKLVLNVAGPFSQTAQPLVEACLSTATSYLDIANEIGVFEKLFEYDAAARKGGIAIIGGVGYGTVATNFLIRQLMAQLPDGDELEIATIPHNTGHSQAAAASTVEVIAEGGRVYRQGKLAPFRLGKGTKPLALAGHSFSITPAPLGDLVAAHRLTNIPDIKVYVVLPGSNLGKLFLPVVQRLLKLKPIRTAFEKRLAAPPSEGSHSPTASYAWASLRNRAGQRVQGGIEMPEGYHFTAISSVQAVEEILRLGPVGSMTPAQAFEADFLTKLDGTREL